MKIRTEALSSLCPKLKCPKFEKVFAELSEQIINSHIEKVLKGRNKREEKGKEKKSELKRIFYPQNRISFFMEYAIINNESHI